MTGIERPYKRTARPFPNGSYLHGPRRYIRDPRFAKDAAMYIRGFMLLQKDLEHLFEYIEPDDHNLECYSFRVYDLLLRASIEVETNCKAILQENGYAKTSNLTMNDYKKIEASHRLSGFEVKMPVWRGRNGIRGPFRVWSVDQALPWYQAYNKTKHNRSEAFKDATFKHAIDAVCGVLVVLSAQFTIEDFPLTEGYVGKGASHGFECAIGDYFVVRYPEWPYEERYNLKEWEMLRKEPDPFQNFPYP